MNNLSQDPPASAASSGLRAPRPLVAVLLGLLAIGLGQHYANRTRRMWLVFGFWTLLPPAMMLLAVKVPSAAGFILPIIMLCAVVVHIDAFRSARAASPYPTRGIQRPLAYVGLVLIWFVAVNLTFTWTKSNLARAFRIPSESMAPTLLPGDFILVDRTRAGVRLPILGTEIVAPRPPAAGELLVFTTPNGQDYVKRCVAVAGDRVETRSKKLLVNGERVEEPYVVHNDPEVSSSVRDNMPGLVIPEGMFLEMGDNRDFSHDGRFYGPIPNENAYGPVAAIYFSMDPENGIRWGRIGTRPE